MYSQTLALRAGKIADGRSSPLWGTGGRRSPARPAETAGGDGRFPGRQDRLVARGSPACQSRDVLLEALAECASDLGRHSSGVGRLAEAAADRLGLERDQREEVRLAGELHDVGKLAIPDGILKKPGLLTRDERFVAEMHSVIGERILAAAPALANVARLVRWSHEWEDGTGYPDRLAGEDIPLGSRVVAVCDAYDAMVSDRPYRRAIGTGAALAELRRSAGSQFDPEVVQSVRDAILEGEEHAPGLR